MGEPGGQKRKGRARLLARLAPRLPASLHRRLARPPSSLVPSAASLVGTPKSQLRQFEAARLEKEGWSEVQSGLEATLRVP